MSTSVPLSQTIMATVLTRLGALTRAGYRHRADGVEERSVDLPDQGTDRVWVYVGDEQKDYANAFGKNACTLPVVVRYRKTERDRSKQARIMRELSADITEAMGTEFEVTDVASQRVTVQVRELTVVRHVEAPEAILLDVLVDFDLVYYHLIGDQATG